MADRGLFVRPRPGTGGILTESMQGLLAFSVLVLMAESLAPAWKTPLYLAFWASLALLFCLRLASRSFVLTVVLSLLVLLLPPFLPILPPLDAEPAPRLILALALAYLVGRAFYLRLRPPSPAGRIGSLYRQPFALVLPMGLWILAATIGLPADTLPFFSLSIAYLALALLRWHRVSLEGQMGRFTALPTQPVATIVRYNRTLLAGTLAVTTALLALSPFLGVSALLAWLGEAFLWLLRRLAALLRGLFTGGTEPGPDPTPRPPDPTPVLPVDPREPAEWLVILLEALKWLFFLVAAGLVVLAAVRGFLLLYRRFHELDPGDADRRESLAPDLASLALGRFQRAGTALRQRFGATPDQRIRRLFQQLVASQVRHGLPLGPGMTPRQIVARLDPERHPDLLSVAALYEAARYGPGPCRPEEAVRMRQLVRKLLRRNLVEEAGGSGG